MNDGEGKSASNLESGPSNAVTSVKCNPIFSLVVSGEGGIPTNFNLKEWWWLLATRTYMYARSRTTGFVCSQCTHHPLYLFWLKRRSITSTPEKKGERSRVSAAAVVWVLDRNNVFQPQFFLSSSLTKLPSIQVKANLFSRERGRYRTGWKNKRNGKWLPGWRVIFIVAMMVV